MITYGVFEGADYTEIDNLNHDPFKRETKISASVDDGIVELVISTTSDEELVDQSLTTPVEWGVHLKLNSSEAAWLIKVLSEKLYEALE